MSGSLTEVRVRDLAFNQTETLELMQESIGSAVAAEAVAQLHERTEGWPVGLRLAALAMPDESSVANQPTCITRHLSSLCFVQLMDA